MLLTWLSYTQSDGAASHRLRKLAIHEIRRISSEVEAYRATFCESLFQCIYSLKLDISKTLRLVVPVFDYLDRLWLRAMFP
jgi:hypothetical protein